MMTLLDEVRAFYKTVDSVYEKNEYRRQYQLNPWWAGENNANMLRILHESSSAQVAIHAIHKTWMFSVNTSQPIKEKAVDWLLDAQRKANLDLFDMPEYIQESAFSNPDNNVLRHKRRLTPDFLRTVSIVEELKRHFHLKDSQFFASDRRLFVLELGAGCGHLARTVKLQIPETSHVIIDIPESLCFSYMFLRLNFPNAKTLFVTETKQLVQSFIKEYDFVFIPTLFSDIILGSKFDLFLNTASMGEMKNSVIRHWMDFIQNKLDVKYLFTLNRYLNTVADDHFVWRMEENECSVLYDSNWRVLHWDLEPLFTRCPYIDGVVARYLALAMERAGPFSMPIACSKSASLLSDVLDEDWIRLDGHVESDMSCRENRMVVDTSMTGTLFKLWESIRLNAGPSNVETMLRYLDQLLRMHDREFEETFYYENLFEKLLREDAAPKSELLRFRERIVARRESRRTPVFLGRPRISLKNEPVSPRLLIEGYGRKFNIVLFKGYYYGFAQELGPVDYSDAALEGYRQQKKKCVAGHTLQEVKRLLDLLHA